jgi:peptide/nickel transport system substrate-binding protein
MWRRNRWLCRSGVRGRPVPRLLRQTDGVVSRRTLRLLAAVGAAALLLLSGCRRESMPENAPGPSRTPVAAASPAPIGYLDESRDGQPADGGTLYRRLDLEPHTLDPLRSTTNSEGDIIALTTRNLLDYDARLDLTAGLADRWEVSDDHRTYTLHIRTDARWEDGSPVTAEDAVFTIEKIRDPKFPAAGFLRSNFEDLKDIEALDAQTFRATFQQPYAFRLNVFHMPIVSKKLYRARSRSAAGNGPYRLDRWKTGETVTLLRSDRYFGARPHADRVVFRILPDDATAYRALTTGELDEMRLPSSLVRETRTDPRFAARDRLVQFFDLSFDVITLNNRSPFFSDPRVRRALTMLFDRGEVVRDLFEGSARVISGPWSPESPAYDVGVDPLPFDPAAARQLLAQAGWTDTDGDGILDREGKPFHFELLVPAGATASEQIAQVFEKDMAGGGIGVDIRRLDAATVFDRQDRGEFEAVLSAWENFDPIPDPYPYYDSSQWPPAGANSGFYKDAGADRLMEEARREFDPKKRREIYHALHRVFRDDPPDIFICSNAVRWGIATRIGGLVTTPLGLFHFWPDSAAWWIRRVPGSSP